MSWSVQKLGGSLSVQIADLGGVQIADCGLRIRGDGQVGDGRWLLIDY